VYLSFIEIKEGAEVKVLVLDHQSREHQSIKEVACNNARVIQNPMQRF